MEPQVAILSSNPTIKQTEAVCPWLAHKRLCALVLPFTKKKKKMKRETEKKRKKIKEIP